ncbi:MAG: hypothetical protein J5693_01305 [Bacteroidales bacterium]|nr:hypothetical protein [Bacteroidales bacterium]
MKIDYQLLTEIVADLGLDRSFVKGQNNPVRKCWHFYTDGSAVDIMFFDEKDFVCGMNRIYTTVLCYNVVILAFVLMDTHIHFVLYGELGDCIRFMQEYIRRTSQYIEQRHGEQKKLAEAKVSHQPVTDDKYLKTVICYVLRNPPVGGLNYNALDYPWSSAALYFRRPGLWTSPDWTDPFAISRYQIGCRTLNDRRTILQTRKRVPLDTEMMGDIVFPGEYVTYEIVERLFKTCRSFHFFMCTAREDDVESRGGYISQLTMPIQELRQHRQQLSYQMFGKKTTYGLDMQQRLRLARSLRARFNSSPKQIAKVCGLNPDEVKDRL